MLKDKKILLTGGNGFVGRYVQQKLKDKGCEDITIVGSDKDLRLRQNATDAVRDIDVVVHLAARVGGIGYNQQFPASLFFDNAMMGLNIIHEAELEGVEKFVCVGTICAYPKFTDVPFKEENLWDGYPEETNAPYGLAKKMLLVQLQAYRKQYGFNGIYLLPVNLYGPGDNFDVEQSHVVPALIKKCIYARDNNEKSVTVWGTGEVSREFLYVEDCAEAIILATEKYNKPDPINIGSGFEIKIKDLVYLIKQYTGYDGEIVWDKTKPDGQPRRKLDIRKAQKEFGFISHTMLEEGLLKTIKWYEENGKNDC